MKKFKVRYYESGLLSIKEAEVMARNRIEARAVFGKEHPSHGTIVQIKEKGDAKKCLINQ